MTSPISNEKKHQALQMAKATQKPGQTKEHTKLIAQGIEKGISEYKKQQKTKARTRDKQRKQSLKIKSSDNQPEEISPMKPTPAPYLPWSLLVLSWMSFIVYIYYF
ncbi:DUF2956 domain-containing protein [Shewanella surugensis]|uniref:DUF2956 domain-containing protein n=1 Tax=Shewanella surugensis TaxID=212020 RepID=A0ABT0L9W7_9GAMM|nr:DUF2956 domain-containing protein [Shewanella surugensis]MCL1124504.1 DUF2956 domain-containing protein [Shewanella surugensis]